MYPPPGRPQKWLNMLTSSCQNIAPMSEMGLTRRQTPPTSCKINPIRKKPIFCLILNHWKQKFSIKEHIPWGETFLQRCREPLGVWGAASGGFRFLQRASDPCLPAVPRHRLKRGAGWTCCLSADWPTRLPSKDKDDRQEVEHFFTNYIMTIPGGGSKSKGPCLLPQHHFSVMELNAIFT